MSGAYSGIPLGGLKNLDEILLQSKELPWREKSLKGISEKMLWRNEETGASIALIRFAKGSGIPAPHSHASNQFMYCISGEYEYSGSNLTLRPGSFYMNPKDSPHGPTVAKTRSLLLEIYDGPHYYEKPSFHTDATIGDFLAKS